MKLLRLVEDQVTLNEPLPWDVRDADGRLLLAKGQVLTDPTRIEALLGRGVFADEEEVRAHERRRRGIPANLAASPPSTLFDAWERMLWRVHDLMKTPPDVPGFADAVEGEVQHLRRLVERDPDVAVFLSVRQDPARFAMYGWAHAIHTAVLCGLIARRLDWPDARGTLLMKAALTMNITTFELQGRMAAQQDPPSASQRKLISGHAADSMLALQQRGVTDPVWLTAVAQHHGLVEGMAGPLTEEAHVLHVADVFMAKISPRLHRPALAIQLAAKQMFQQDAGGPVAAAVIREFGIYPPGEFVRLKNGELALVVRRAANAGTPQVASITNARGAPVPATTVRDTARPEFAIAAVEPVGPLALRTPPERLYGVIPFG